MKFGIKMFFLPFVVLPLLITWGALRNTLIKSIGTGWWGRGMAFFVVLEIILSILPFVLIFKGVFASGGFSTFLGTGKRAQEIRKSGFPARATVVGIGESSRGTVTINGQPFLSLKLRIDDGHKAPYDVSLETIIPRASVPQFQPGAAFPVKVDRDDPNSVVFDPEGSATGSEPDFKPTVGGADWTDFDETMLEQQGKDGLAKLLAVEETGRSKDFNPVVRLSYEVFVPRQEPYTFTKEVPIPSLYAQQLRSVVGRSFPARVHPHDRTKIKVDVTF